MAKPPKHPSTPTPYDALFKTFLNDRVVAKDFLCCHLPANIKARCDWSTLAIQSPAFVEPDLRQHFADILYSVQINDRPGYILCLIEHETQPSPLTAWRMHRYAVAAIQRHLEQEGGSVLPLVVPLLFYRGKRTPYPYSTTVTDYFYDPVLAKEVWMGAYPLIDLSVIPDDELRTHKSVALLEIVQKNIDDLDLLEMLPDICDGFGRTELSPKLVVSLLHFLYNVGECSDYSAFFEKIAHENPHYRENVMTIAQQLRQEGRKEGWQEGEQLGLQKGRQEGLQEGLQKMARSMLSEHEPIEKIARYTGLTEDEIMLLQTKH